MTKIFTPHSEEKKMDKCLVKAIKIKKRVKLFRNFQR